MSDRGGWLGPDFFRAGPGGELPVVSVTRLPPDLTGKLPLRSDGSGYGIAQDHPAGEPGYGSSEPGFAFGSVRGYRWWGADTDPADGVLRGMHAPWVPGENRAECLDTRRRHALDDLPSLSCFCGFYAHWTVQPPYAMGPYAVPVLGVIEGWGKVLIGTRGFRCQVAKILAICPVMRPRPGDDLVISALARAYPDVAIYPSAEAMCAEFGPDELYSPQQ